MDRNWCAADTDRKIPTGCAVQRANLKHQQYQKTHKLQPVNDAARWLGVSFRVLTLRRSTRRRWNSSAKADAVNPVSAKTLKFHTVFACGLGQLDVEHIGNDG